MTTYALPTDDRDFMPSTMELTPLHNARASVSPLSGYTQSSELPGQRWQFVLGYGEQRQPVRDKLEAFFQKIGVEHRLSLWDMGSGNRDGRPRGTIATTGVTVSSTAAQFATSVVLAGCGASATLLGNSKWSVNGQLLVTAEDATANGSGVMTVNIRPMLRSQATAGAAVTLIKPTATFWLPEPLVFPRARGGICPAFTIRAVEAP